MSVWLLLADPPVVAVTVTGEVRTQSGVRAAGDDTGGGINREAIALSGSTEDHSYRVTVQVNVFASVALPSDTVAVTV